MRDVSHQDGTDPESSKYRTVHRHVVDMPDTGDFE